MLKTSPVLSASANASPSSFHHGTSRSSQESSSRPPLALSPKSHRRPSSRSTLVSSSASSSSESSRTGAARPRQNAVDLITSQPAPASIMSVGTDRASSSVAASTSISTSHISTPSEPPPRPCPLPLTTTPHAASSSSQAQSPTHMQIQNKLSPNKRRNHSGDWPEQSAEAPTSASARASGSDVATADAEETPASGSSKRARPDQQPPKILPQRYEHCPVQDMVELIAHMLGELIATNDAIRISSGGLTRFHSRTAPGISVRDYLHRLARHATLTPPLLLAMVYYIDRLCALYPEFTINTLTVHRFLITAATVAAKGLSDSFWNNTTYARVGGVRVAELKMLELEFLYRVDWKIVPNPEVLVAYYQGLVQRAPGYALESDGTTSDYETDEDEDEEDEAEEEEEEEDDE